MKINLNILASEFIADDEKFTTLNEKEIVSNMMIRRRLTRNARIAIYLAHKLDAFDLPIVIGNAYGEVVETFEILKAINEQKTLSPTHFQNSVHNTPASYLSIIAENKGYITTVSDLYQTSNTVLKVGAIKSLKYKKMLLIVVDSIDFECVDILNRCSIKKKESGIAMIVEATAKEPTIKLGNKSFKEYSPSLWKMLEIHEKLSNKENIVAIDII
ncbi:MAG: beta-ketoacyl synthase chain length factor [Campylobacterales bacterium]|nr:beta-ketoacyl synthase chain length factor [Campylobacterales bacterium]